MHHIRIIIHSMAITHAAQVIAYATVITHAAVNMHATTAITLAATAIVIMHTAIVNMYAAQQLCTHPTKLIFAVVVYWWTNTVAGMSLWNKY